MRLENRTAIIDTGINKARKARYRTVDLQIILLINISVALKIHFLLTAYFGRGLPPRHYRAKNLSTRKIRLWDIVQWLRNKWQCHPPWELWKLSLAVDRLCESDIENEPFGCLRVTTMWSVFPLLHHEKNSSVTTTERVIWSLLEKALVYILTTCGPDEARFTCPTADQNVHNGS